MRTIASRETFFSCTETIQFRVLDIPLYLLILHLHSEQDRGSAPIFGWAHVSLFVRQFGTTGPAVILIHGGPDWDQSYFFPFLAPLAHSCRLIAFDLRGCGRSQKFHDPECYRLDLAVEVLAQLLERLQLEGSILLGFSFGGRVALRFLDRYPAKVSKLILASSTAYENGTDELEHWEE